MFNHVQSKLQSMCNSFINWQNPLHCRWGSSWQFSEWGLGFTYLEKTTFSWSISLKVACCVHTGKYIFIKSFDFYMFSNSVLDKVQSSYCLINDLRHLCRVMRYGCRQQYLPLYVIAPHIIEYASSEHLQILHRKPVLSWRILDVFLTK